MARDFDGVNDKIDYGSDASIDNFAIKTISAWVVFDTIGITQLILGKSASTSQWVFIIGGGGNVLILFDQWSAANARWDASTVFAAGNMHHVALTYDGGNVLNDPIIYVDGVAETITEITAPTLTRNSDAAQPLLSGETSSGGSDMDGRIGWLSYDNSIWTPSKINRARWWGTPGGSIQVHHPLVTDSLANKGTATANGTATGTAMSSLPRVERNHGSMMGCGR